MAESALLYFVDKKYTERNGKIVYLNFKKIKIAIRTWEYGWENDCCFLIWTAPC